MNKIVKFGRKVMCSASKNSSTIMVVFGTLALGGAIYTTVKGTISAVNKVENAVEERKMEENAAEMTKKEVVQLVWKDYIPALAFTLLVIACYGGAHIVDNKQKMALMTVAGLSQEALKTYKEAVEEVVEPEKMEEITNKVIEKKLEKTKIDEIPEIPHVGDDEELYLIMDEFSGQPFWSNKNKIDAAVNEINRRLRDEMYICVNEFYYLLGIRSCLAGDLSGWTIDTGYMDAKLAGTTLDAKGRPCRLLSYDNTTLKGDYKRTYRYERY